VLKFMDVLTPADVAKLLTVSERTVRKWCESGKLPSYKIPGSRHRRISIVSLRQFLLDFGVDTNLIPKLTVETLEVNCDEDGVRRVKVAIVTINNVDHISHDGKLWLPIEAKLL